MPYCSSEGHFQGYEDELEIEVDDTEAVWTGENHGQLVANLTLNRLCAGCSQTSATATLEITIDFDHACPKADADNEPEMEVTSDFEGTTTDRYETIDARGKRIPSRFQRRYIGAEISGSIECSLCEETIELTGSDEMTAGSFEVEAH